jgi:hypothetical protein
VEKTSRDIMVNLHPSDASKKLAPLAVAESMESMRRSHLEVAASTASRLVSSPSRNKSGKQKRGVAERPQSDGQVLHRIGSAKREEEERIASFIPKLPPKKKVSKSINRYLTRFTAESISHLEILLIIGSKCRRRILYLVHQLQYIRQLRNLFRLLT